jgi:hypothetical protein
VSPFERLRGIRLGKAERFVLLNAVGPAEEGVRLRGGNPVADEVVRRAVRTLNRHGLAELRWHGVRLTPLGALVVSVAREQLATGKRLRWDRIERRHETLCLPGGGGTQQQVPGVDRDQLLREAAEQIRAILHRGSSGGNRQIAEAAETKADDVGAEPREHAITNIEGQP